MHTIQRFLAYGLCLLSIACTNPTATTTADATNKVDTTKPTPTASTEAPATHRVVPSADIQWGALNPARGDKSPKAGDLWGDRTKDVATGFLVEFVDGFASPPHIHNVSYRAIVLDGLIHNNDPKSPLVWMPVGSYWTQPAGEAHITAAKGLSRAYVEIDQGPYLVHPTEQAFDNGEVDVNLIPENQVWLDALLIESATEGAAKAMMMALWKKNDQVGQLIKLPAGFDGIIQGKGNAFHAVVIQGTCTYGSVENTSTTLLDAGSYFTSNGTFNHPIQTEEEVIVYIRSSGLVHVG